jgi:hypothetical protein
MHGVLLIIPAAFDGQCPSSVGRSRTRPVCVLDHSTILPGRDLVTTSAMS